MAIQKIILRYAPLFALIIAAVSIVDPVRGWLQKPVISYSAFTYGIGGNDSDLKVLYKGMELDKLETRYINFTNETGAEIRKSSFDSPMILSFDGEGEIIDVKVEKDKNDLNEYILDVDGLSVKVGEFFLRNGDSFSLIVYSSKNIGTLSVNGQIAGVLKFQETYSNQRYSFVNIYRFVLGISIFGIGSFILFLNRVMLEARPALKGMNSPFGGFLCGIAGHALMIKELYSLVNGARDAYWSGVWLSLIVCVIAFLASIIASKTREGTKNVTEDVGALEQERN